MTEHIRHGFSCVRPYVCGPVSLVGFLEKVFGAVELERHAFSEDSFHVELRIGDSVLAMEAGPLPDGVAPWGNSVYVYVPDVDQAYLRAMEHGAESLAEPTDKPYGERQAGFRDEAGNTWWIGTFMQVQQ